MNTSKQDYLTEVFENSKAGPCLFYSDEAICLVYVDDTIIFAKDQNKIKSVIDSLKSEFVWTDEGDVKSFLGVKITHHKDGTIDFTQPSLIQNLLKLLNL